MILVSYLPCVRPAAVRYIDLATMHRTHLDTHTSLQNQCHLVLHWFLPMLYYQFHWWNTLPYQYLDLFQIGMDCEDQWKLPFCIWNHWLGEPFGGWNTIFITLGAATLGGIRKMVIIGNVATRLQSNHDTQNRQAGFWLWFLFQSSHLLPATVT